MPKTLPDQFMSPADVYDKVSKSAHDQMWKLYEKFDFHKISKELASRPIWKKFAKERTGLDFKKISVLKISGKGDDGMEFILKDTGKQDLGFFGNYIETLHYYFHSSGGFYSIEYNPKTKQFLRYFDAGISYTHTSGGGNGVSDRDEYLITYNLNTKELVFKKRD